MNDIDTFENDLRRMLNQSVDDRLGSRRPAPPFQPVAAGPESVRPARRWLLPLAVAACVVALAVGTVSATQLLDAHRHGPTPGNSMPGTSTPPASASGTPSSSTSTVAPAPPVTAGPSRSTTPAGPVVHLGGATLHLPAGWVARDYQQYLRSGSSTLEQAWCLTPAATPVGTGRYDCPVQFSTIADKAASSPVDTDTEGGYASDPHYCDNGVYLSSTVQSSDVDFGGRASDHRRWVRTCHNGDRYRIEQYVVATGPGYILWSETADDQISAVLAQLVATATLPAQTSAVRYYDQGYVRSITPAAGGVRISLDRVVPGSGGLVNNNPRTYDYFVPQSAKPAGLHVGELISLFTDGSQVTLFY